MDAHYEPYAFKYIYFSLCFILQFINLSLSHDAFFDDFPVDAPQVSIEGFDGNWYVKRADVKLVCKADSNPPPSFYRWGM